jgi:hypothetical protein
LFASSTSASFDDDQLEDGTPDDSGPATEDQPTGALRSAKEQLMANYAAFIIRNRSI